MADKPDDLAKFTIDAINGKHGKEAEDRVRQAFEAATQQLKEHSERRKTGDK